MSEMLQGSDAWVMARLGKATASRIAEVVAKTKVGWGASRVNYAAELIAERLTGVPYPTFSSPAMIWGTEKEPEARVAYEFLTNSEVNNIGFIPHPTIAMSGASPDALVGNDGLLEIKCPQSATHLHTLLGAAIDGKYIKQIQWQLACSGRRWCDWVSYDPRMPGNMRLYVKRVIRDGKMIETLEREVIEFLAEVDGKVDALNKMYGEKAAA